MGHPASSRQGAPLGEGFFPHFVGGIHNLKSLLFSPYPAIPPYAARTPHPGITDDHENSCAQRLPESGACICSHGTLLMGGAHPQPKTYQFTSRASSEDTVHPERGQEQAQDASDWGGDTQSPNCTDFHHEHHKKTARTRRGAGSTPRHLC